MRFASFSALALSLVMVSSTLAETPPTQTREGVPDGWHGWLSYGAYPALTFTAGCGSDLLTRRQGKRLDYDVSLSTHRATHGIASGVATSAYLASAWQLHKVNTQRDKLEFRHTAHNVLFLTGVGSVVAVGVFGFPSSHEYSNGNDERGERHAEVMQTMGHIALAVDLGDLVLFERHDNASLIGYKIRFQ